MKLSARNQLAGVVREIEMGVVTARVVLDVNGQRLTAVVTKEAVEDLGLKEGDRAVAVIKSTEVILMTE